MIPFLPEKSLKKVLTNDPECAIIRPWKGKPQERKERTIMKTVEMIKWGKGYYVTTRFQGRAIVREFIKTKTDALTRVKELKKEGYVEA